MRGVPVLMLGTLVNLFPTLPPPEPGAAGGQCQCDTRGSASERCDASGLCQCKVSHVPTLHPVPIPGWGRQRHLPHPAGQRGRPTLCHLPPPPLPPECRKPGGLPALLLHGHRAALHQHLLHPRHGESPVPMGPAGPCHHPVSPRHSATLSHRCELRLLLGAGRALRW